MSTVGDQGYLYDIVSRQKRAPLAIASPSDFMLREIGKLDTIAGAALGTVYCSDFGARHVWFTRCNDSDTLYDAPFLWRAQYERAYQIATIPFALVEDLAADPPARPTFIFSVGRCGSTLISGLLRAAGAHVVSEPDLLSQLSIVDPRRVAPAGDHFQAALMRLCLSSLAGQGGSNPVVKLRSQCNILAADIAHAFPGARFAVILRERGSWVRSRYKAFGGEPFRFIHTYKSGIETYDRLWCMGRDPHLIWYEDIVRDPAGVLRDLFDVGISPDDRGAERLSPVMETDSQQGTPLAKNLLPERALTAGELDELEEEWRRISPVDAISRHSLERCR